MKISRNTSIAATDKESRRSYYRWFNIIRRCDNTADTSYDNYGGRGITVCDRWYNYENYIEDVGDRPTPKHTIDRIDNDGNYEPSNVKWSTRLEQVSNRRMFKSNKSGHAGIYWYSPLNKWLVRPTVGGKLTYLGYFKTLSGAVKAKEQLC